MPCIPFRPPSLSMLLCQIILSFNKYLLRSNHVPITIKGAIPTKCYLLSRVWFFATPWTIACQASLSMEFSQQEYWSGLPFPSPGDLPNPGIEPGSLHCGHILYHLTTAVLSTRSLSSYSLQWNGGGRQLISKTWNNEANIKCDKCFKENWVM